jgi:hypothetical protein
MSEEIAPKESYLNNTMKIKFGNYVSENVIIRWTHQQGEGTHSTSCSCFCSSLLVLLLADMSYFRSWNSQIYSDPDTRWSHYSGEPCAAKVACTVREGEVGNGLIGPSGKFTTLRSLPFKNALKKSLQSGKVVVSKIISYLALPEKALKSLYVIHFGSCVQDNSYYLGQMYEEYTMLGRT